MKINIKLNILINYKMGIYSDNNIYGIRIYISNNDDTKNILYEVKLDEIMSHEQIREAYLFFNNLDNKNKDNINFRVYTKCFSTYDEGSFMSWWSISLDTFLEEFDI